MDAVIYDVDGTLVDVSSVRHYVFGPDRDFDKFHNSSLFCPPIEVVRNMARAHFKGTDKVIIVTARDARYERVTRDWLFKHDVRFHKMYMRPWGDQRRDAIVKREILDTIIDDGFRPRLAVDDNPTVIDVWKAAGIPTITIPGWTDDR